MPDYWNIRNFYFSFFRSPYETENVEKEQNEYLEHEWLYDGKTCIGLPLAIILKTAAPSIHESDWSAAFVYITKDGEALDCIGLAKASVILGEVVLFILGQEL